MKVKEPFLLVFSILWILFFLLPVKLHWKGTHRPMTWPERMVVAGIGLAFLLLWYSLK